ncbi:MAG: undecaprenyl-diphosphate phosphatase [Eubacteriales bacterium]|nr:undecaprenyl-diphosphate phosphatase [Eubacteriales bacterium]
MMPDIIEILKVIFLGIVEGITEWLPISSTGHMLLVDEFLTLNQSESFKEMFFVVIQLGAIIAVVVMFWKKMWPFQIKDKSQPKVKMNIINMWLKVVVACIPSAVLGLLFDDFLEEHFGHPISIAVMLIVYGIAFIIVEKWNKTRTPKVQALDDISYKTAFIIGMFQVLSMIPGTSRSGATIIGALLIGVSRTAAAEFTFFLAVPTMVGASALKLLKFGLSFTMEEIIILVVGMAVAFIVSLLCIKWLMSFIKKHDFTVFGWYRIVLGIVVILYFALIAG